MTAQKPVRALAVAPGTSWPVPPRMVLSSCGTATTRPQTDRGRRLAPVGRLSPDGKVVAAGGLDGKLWAWETVSGKKLFDTLAQAPPMPKAEVIPNLVSALAFAPDGKQVALGGSSGQVYLFQATDGKLVRAMQQPHSAGVTAVVFHPGSAALASASRDRVVRLWNPTSGQLLKALEGHTG